MYVDFEVNPELEKIVLGSIPKGYYGIKKAIYIYVKLCRTLKYSMDYFVGKQEAIDYFRDPANIKNIDGINNKDVVCYVFNAILMKLYYKADLRDEISDYGYRFTDDGKFVDEHFTAQAQIASFWSDFDGTKGRIKDNDLTALKYSDKVPTGWKMHDKRIEKFFDETLHEVIAENPVEMSNQEEYLKKVAAKFNGKQNEYPLKDRVDLFLRSIDIADNELFGFNNLIVLSDLLFTQDERTYNKNDSEKDNIYFKIVKEKATSELKCLLYYKNSKIKDLDKQLKIYEISVSDQTYKEIGVDEIIKRIDSHYYTKKHGETLEYPEVINEYKAVQME